MVPSEPTPFSSLPTEAPQVRDLTVQHILAFGNVSVSLAGGPDAFAPRLDWCKPELIMQDGEPDLFLALQWRYRLVPTLHGREREKQKLLDWARGGGNSISVRLLSGGGGSGKTRLAAEVASVLQEDGWSAGFIPLHAQQAQTLSVDKRKCFLIFDYPEERFDVVRSLVAAIRDIDDEKVPFPIRILFVSRRDREEWEEIGQALGHRFGRSEIAKLSSLTRAEALSLFEETREAFAALTGREIETNPDDAFFEKAEGWFASAEANRVPLVAMAAGIHQVLSGRDGFDLGAPDLIEAIAKTEQQRVNAISRAGGLGAHGLSRLLGLAVFSADGLTEAQCEALAKLEATELGGQKLMDRLRDTPWWRQSDSGDWRLARPQPDRMAAIFAGLTLLDQPSGRLPEWLAVPSVAMAEAFIDRLARIHYDFLQNSSAWPRNLDQALVEMLDNDPGRISVFFEATESRGSIFSAHFSSAILERVLRQPDLPDETRGRLLNNYANFLSELGEREAALKASEEAADLYRVLAETRPEVFTPDLAMSLNNLANRLSDLGQKERALTAAEEAVALRRTLVAARPEAFTPDLAMSLNNLATFLSDLGHRERALAVAGEAVDLYRALAVVQSEAFMPDLAMSLNNLANQLSDLGQFKAALEVAEEAVHLYQVLAEATPEAFVPHLAASLSNLGGRLYDLDHKEAALTVLQNAVDLRRTLALARPEAFKSNLAMSLNNLAISLSTLGRRDEALLAAEEAVDLYRALAAARSDAFTPNLATSLNSLANRLSELGQKERALAAAEEAVDLYRALAAARPDAFIPNLAMSLGAISRIYRMSKQTPKALDCLSEAIAVIRPLFLRLPAAHAGLTEFLYYYYIECCEELEIEPDIELLAPIVEAIEALNESQNQER